MRRQVLIEGYRPGGREVFLSGRPLVRGYRPEPGSKPSVPPPAPKPPTGGSAVSTPKK